MRNSLLLGRIAYALYDRFRRRFIRFYALRGRMQYAPTLHLCR